MAGNGVNGPVIPGGLRATPGYQPVPNSAPVGSRTGAPPYSRFVRLQLPPNEATQIVQGTPENRVAVLTAPLEGFTIFVGQQGLTVGNGVALTPGIPYEAILVGLQDLWAIHDAPVMMSLQVQISIVLLAERQRVLDGG